MYKKQEMLLLAWWGAYPWLKSYDEHPEVNIMSFGSMTYCLLQITRKTKDHKAQSLISSKWPKTNSSLLFKNLNHRGETFREFKAPSDREECPHAWILQNKSTKAWPGWHKHTTCAYINTRAHITPCVYCEWSSCPGQREGCCCK